MRRHVAAGAKMWGPPMPAAANQRQTPVIPQTGNAARHAIRNGEWTGPTSGLAPGRLKTAWVEQDRLAKYASDHFPIGLELT